MNKNNGLKNIVLWIVSIIIGFLCYRFIGLHIIDRIYYINNVYKGLFLCFCHIDLVYILLKCIFKIKLSYLEKMITMLMYFILMSLCFFDRINIGERIISLDPFAFIDSAYNDSVVLLFLNIAVFIPFYTVVKWLKQNLNDRMIFILFILCALSVEVLQYVTMRGMLDLADMILYTLGYGVGCLGYQAVMKFVKDSE